MKITTSNGKAFLTISRGEWDEMGRTASWKDIVHKVKGALSPDPTNPYIDRSEQMRDENGTYQLTPVMQEQEIVNTPASKIDTGQLQAAVDRFASSDAELLFALPKAMELIKNPTTNPKTADGMKVMLNRFFKLRPNHPARKQAEEVLKKWYREKKQSEISWGKPKNPYIAHVKTQTDERTGIRITLSRTQWETIGTEGGWLGKNALNPGEPRAPNKPAMMGQEKPANLDMPAEKLPLKPGTCPGCGKNFTGGETLCPKCKQKASAPAKPQAAGATLPGQMTIYDQPK